MVIDYAQLEGFGALITDRPGRWAEAVSSSMVSIWI
jgi:hypothetical protein